MAKTATNPFRFGALALGDAFTDRQAELRELAAALRNGQDVLVYAPRRYGKSSLVLRAARAAARDGALVGYVDLLKVTSKERFAAALARTIHRDLDTAAGRAHERAAELFRGLRIVPSMDVDPQDGSLQFSFRATRRRTDIDDTVEALLELVGRLAVERKRRVVMIFDEFQEIVELDRRYPNLLRAVFQLQPEVAHVYLGSKRHVLDRIFGDRNEPFWRSAKKLEIGLIGRAVFARFIRSRFERTDKGITDDAAAHLLDCTAGHPYGTQELAYEVWERTPSGAFAYDSDVEAALENVLRAEHNHLEQLWADAPRTQRRLLAALALEPTASPYAEDYRLAYELPPAPTLQSALTSLTRKELVGRLEDGRLAIVEPFLAAWVLREQRF
ncbi:MAG TPA: ATP-binding protein [Gaiellaceae bacterium]|nr:ATP-binding protein [Gaiellaceae bacterium]